MSVSPVRREALALLVAPFLVACGSDDITGVTVNAAVRVVLDDNPTRTAPPVNGPQEAPPPGDYEGTLATTTRVAISADGETWHDVMGTRALNVPLQAGDSVSVENTVSVPAATYSYVRLTLRGASMTVTGDVPGASVTNRTLDVADAEVVMIRAIPAVTLSASTHARLAFDLNTEAWLSPSAVESRRIPGSPVEAAVEATSGYEG